MNNIDWTPALATAFLGEIEEIEGLEKVAILGTLMKGMRNTGKGWLKQVVKGGRGGQQGAFKYWPKKPLGIAPPEGIRTGWVAGKDVTLGQMAKFYGGRALAKHPGKVLIGGGVGTAAALS
jgi:hypothetical protein